MFTGRPTYNGEPQPSLSNQTPPHSTRRVLSLSLCKCGSEIQLSLHRGHDVRPITLLVRIRLSPGFMFCFFPCAQTNLSVSPVNPRDSFSDHVRVNLFITAPRGGERSIVMNVSVCLSVCFNCCLSETLSSCVCL